MATAKKTATKTTAVATRQSGAVVDVKAMMKDMLERNKEKTAPATGNKIRVTQSKEFVLPDGTKTRDPIQLVVVDFTSRNEFYAQAYDKDNIQPPACFAIGDIPKQLVPSNNSPEKQCEDCASCPQNVFGSAENGRGKACKNTRLLAVLPPDADDKTPMWLLSVSPTAIKSFDAFVNRAANVLGTPPAGAVVTVSTNEAVDNAELVFSDEQPNENAGVALSRLEEARKMLEAEPDVSTYGQQKAAPAKKAPVKSAAVKRPVTTARR